MKKLLSGLAIAPLLLGACTTGTGNNHIKTDPALDTRAKTEIDIIASQEIESYMRVYGGLSNNTSALSSKSLPDKEYNQFGIRADMLPIKPALKDFDKYIMDTGDDLTVVVNNKVDLSKESGYKSFIEHFQTHLENAANTEELTHEGDKKCTTYDRGHSFTAHPATFGIASKQVEGVKIEFKASRCTFKMKETGAEFKTSTDFVIYASKADAAEADAFTIVTEKSVIFGSGKAAFFNGYSPSNGNDNDKIVFKTKDDEAVDVLYHDRNILAFDGAAAKTFFVDTVTPEVFSNASPDESTKITTMKRKLLVTNPKGENETVVSEALGFAYSDGTKSSEMIMLGLRADNKESIYRNKYNRAQLVAAHINIATKTKEKEVNVYFGQGVAGSGEGFGLKAVTANFTAETKLNFTTNATNLLFTSTGDNDNGTAVAPISKFDVSMIHNNKYLLTSKYANSFVI